MRRSLRIAFLVALLYGELAAVLLLRRLGTVDGFAVPAHDVGRWLTHAPTEDLVAVAARLVGLTLAYWLLTATVLSLARRVVPAWRRLRVLDVVTPAALRHALDRALVIGLGASLAATGLRPATAGARESRSPVTVSITPTSPARAAGADEPVPRTPIAEPRADSPAPVNEPAGEHVVVVRAGDNLWVLAQRALEHGTDDAQPGEIAPYWKRVIAANAATLRSHDPDLIFPGERVVLPPPTNGDTAPG
jgi:nucleoid-associated protein YgaU